MTGPAPATPAPAMRWGVSGTGRAAANFIGEIRRLPGVRVTAVSSHQPGRAAAFAAGQGIPVACDSAAALAERDDVDIVYVAGAHPDHRADAEAALRRGKPALVEKPMTLRAADTAALAGLARERGVFLMEGMWTRCFPAMEQAREWIQDGAIGDVRAIRVDIGHAVPFDPASRLFDPARGGGALLDLGVYALALISWCWDARPDTAHGLPRMNRAGTDSGCAIALSWRDGRLAAALCALDQHLSREATLYGERGRIVFPAPFWRPTHAELLRDDGATGRFEQACEGRGYAYEAGHVMDCVRAGFIESPLMPLDESVALAALMDRVRADWPMRYPGDPRT